MMGLLDVSSKSKLMEDGRFPRGCIVCLCDAFQKGFSGLSLFPLRSDLDDIS